MSVNLPFISPTQWDDRVDSARMVQETYGSAMSANMSTGILGALAAGTASAARPSLNKSFTVKPIKNGYLLLVNNEEFYCADLAAVGTQVVAIMAAHMME